jgi:hypothetical protein
MLQLRVNLVSRLPKLPEQYELNTRLEPIEKYPRGWPQLAAFLNSEDNFAIFRRFGNVHCRLLVHLQAEIQILEHKLKELDESDASPSSPHRWRLQKADFGEEGDPGQRDIRRQLQEKILVYGMSYLQPWRPCLGFKLINVNTDQLLLNDQKLRDLGQASEKDHQHVYHWIVRERPVAFGQDDWINHPYDFVPLSKIDQLESMILSSFLKVVSSRIP